MKTPTALTASQITRLTAKVTGQSVPRSANKEKAVGRLFRALCERIGEGQARKALPEILSAPGSETAEGRLYAAIEADDAIRAAAAAEVNAELAEAERPREDDTPPSPGVTTGASFEDEPAAPKSKTKRSRTNWRALEEAAKEGKMPPPPDFSAPTHARFRGKLAELVKLAEAGDIAALEAVEINPVSSSPKTMLRYRDICVTALKAREARS